MPTYYARKSGNVNATDVWATTPSGTASDLFPSFTNQDVLVANSFTVTLNVNTTVQEVRNDTTGGATVGGTFNTTTTAVTLTANVIGGGTINTAGCVTASGSGACTIVGAVTAGTIGSAVSLTGSGLLTITGSVTGGQSGYGVISSAASGSLSVTGTVTGGPGQFGMHCFTGNLAASVTGSVVGAQGLGINFAIAGSLTVTGTATGGAAAGVQHSAAGTVTVTRAKGGPNASSAVGVVGSSTGSTSVEEIEYGDLGASPVSGPIRLSDTSSNVAVMYRFGTTKKTLTDPNATGLMPSAANVRFGTVYNGGNSTGTMRVPAAGSVALGVPVDNTTGTAALTPAAVWNYATSAATASGSMGERLKDAATVASTGQQLANALTPS